MFDVTFRVMNTAVTRVALPNTLNDFTDVQKISAVKNGLMLTTTIAATHESGSIFNVSPMDIGKIC